MVSCLFLARRFRWFLPMPPQPMSATVSFSGWAIAGATPAAASVAAPAADDLRNVRRVVMAGLREGMANGRREPVGGFRSDQPAHAGRLSIADHVQHAGRDPYGEDFLLRSNPVLS